MKRLALKPILLLFLGAIINIAVAWGCAVWVHLDKIPLNRTFHGLLEDVRTDDPRTVRRIDLERREAFGAARVTIAAPVLFHYRQLQILPGTLVTGPTPIEAPGSELLPPIGHEAIGGDTDVIIDWRGWPFRSMWCIIDLHEDRGTWSTQPSRGGVQFRAFVAAAGGAAGAGAGAGGAAGPPKGGSFCRCGRCGPRLRRTAPSTRGCCFCCACRG